MRDYFETSIWTLRLNRIDDKLFSDTFFSSISSIRGCKCFQIFAFKKSKFVTIKLMKRKVQALESYEDVIRSIDAPNRTITDDALVCTGDKWTSIKKILY